MATLILSDDGHIELPAEIRDSLSVKAGDVLDVSVSNGEIHLRPQARDKQVFPGRGVDISPWIGAGTGLFGSLEEIDDYIRKERDAWD